MGQAIDTSLNSTRYDVVVIGGGPAGMEAALAARERGAHVALVERNDHLGGILRQCIHPGFGLTHFKEELTGPEYAQRFIDLVERTDIEVMLDSMVLAIDGDEGRDTHPNEAAHTVTVMSHEGMRVLTCRSVVLAMGCRERTRSEIKIPGSRPAGVFTAGLAQRYINTENLRPARRAVILGSGDIGLIMARRCALEGIEVEGVYEIMPHVSGLMRNVRNCLDDFGIPLHLSTTVTRVIGRSRVEAVEVSRVEGSLSPIPGTERIIPCDALLLSVGLIPENELSVAAGVKLDPRTRGAVVDEYLQTTVAGIFSCGNVLHVHELVDNVTAEARRAGSAAAAYARDGEAGLAGLKCAQRELSKQNEAENPAETLGIHPLGNDADAQKRENLPLDDGRQEREARTRLEDDEELRRFSCTTCPKGCELTVRVAQREDGSAPEVLEVSGNRCRRGDAFAHQEIARPARTLTTTVTVSHGDERLLPVRTATPLPLDLHMEAMGALNALTVEAPIRMGDVVVANILNSGVDIVASMDAVCKP